MDAGDGDIKKRKTAATFALRKKPRRSAHEKSEFRSMEVGLREFKKRLAASNLNDDASSVAVTQNARKPKLQGNPTVTAINTTLRQTEEAQNATKTGKKAASKKVATAGKVSTKKKMAVAPKTPVMKPSGATKKRTLTEVKAQMEQEQKDRIEYRILTLHRDVKPVASPRVPVGATATATTTTVPDRAALTAPSLYIDSATVVQPQNLVDNCYVNAKLTPTEPSSDATYSRVMGVGSTHDATASSHWSAIPPSSLVKNKFIADDSEEDYIFAMALEEVERKLAMPRNLPFGSDIMVATDSVAVASDSLQTPVLRNLLYAIPPIKAEPSLLLNTAQQKVMDAVEDKKGLNTMERLQREHDLSRRSIELLHAAVTIPAHAKDSREMQHVRIDQTVTHRRKNEFLQSLKATELESLVLASTSRYLDLASDQNIKQSVSAARDDDQISGYAPHKHFVEVQNNSLETLCKDVQTKVPADTREDCDGLYYAGTEKPTHKPEKMSDLLKASTSSASPSTLLTDRFSSCGIEQKPKLEHEIESFQRAQSAKRFEPKVQVHKHSLFAKIGCNGDEVVAVNIQKASKEDERVYQEIVENAPRTSTIDRGSCAQYKINQETMTEDESDLESLDDKAAVLDEEVAPPQSPSWHLNSKPVACDALDGILTGMSANIEIIERIIVSSFIDIDTGIAYKGENKAVVSELLERPDGTSRLSSSSSSASDSDAEEDESDDTISSNVLEAALKAVGSDAGRPSSMIHSAGLTSDFSANPQASKTASSAGSLAIHQNTRESTGLSSTSTKKAFSAKSCMLWPALDEFYDFLLEMSPKKIRSETHRAHLQQFFGKKLPAQYSTIKDYCNLQREAILEELAASVSNIMTTRGKGGSGPIRHLSLASVTPCGRQRRLTPSVKLSLGALFSKSAFTGNESSNDYILTFNEPGPSMFVSGDLILLRSPRWKNYEMRVFGVVLCDSVVAVGGPRGNCETIHESDQICVLIRVQGVHRDDGIESFHELIDLCLSNLQTSNWQWSMQQVYNTTTSAREFQAIKAIAYFPDDLQQELASGHLSLVVNMEKSKVELPSMLSPRLMKYLNEHFNDSQLAAIHGCLGEEGRVIIQGPPGTGKTKTILGLLSALLEGAGLSSLCKAKATTRIRVGASLQKTRTPVASTTVSETAIRVLVTAPSNAAVDELVVRVLSEGLCDGEKGGSYRPRIVRVGCSERSQQLSSANAARKLSDSKKKRKYTCDVEEVLLESLLSKHRSSFPTVKEARRAIIKNAQIVFCTLSGAGSVAMCEAAQDFDALIIDEAAQAVEASALIPLKFRPQRIVLVGDHRQLPATVISKKLVSMGYDRSLQQRLVENGSPVLLLTQQYRMHPEIAAFPSTYFYHGRLVQDENMREWTAQDYHAHRAFKPLLFLDVQGAQSQVCGSTSLRNVSEVEAVIQIIRHLLTRFPHTEWKKRIGVIAPYKQQIYEVRASTKMLETEFNRQLGIEVNTVDGFQGREKEIIIYSCVRTSRGGRRRKSRRSAGHEKKEVFDTFWAEERRMNVAITRAKSSLWIVGNSTLLMQSVAWRAFIKHIKSRNRFISNGYFT